MKIKTVIRLFITISLILTNTVVWAGGRWQIARNDDFNRKDGVEGDLKDVFFVDEKNGWSVGMDLILHTSDGGANWEVQNTSAEGTLMLWSLYFPNAKSGIVVGAAGGGFRGRTAIFTTENGGKRWTQQRVEARSRLTDICMVDEKVGYAAGESNTVLKTDDGGLTWNLLFSGQRARAGETRNNFDGVCFVTQKVGWVVGSYGTIMHTNDGGKNWEPQKIDLPNNLYGVYFVSETEGWIVGQEGVILHTVDGGKKWEQQKSGVEDSLYRVVFLDKNTGWACGDFGTVVHTTDGGKTWKRENTGTKTNLRGIAAFKGYCWAVGEWGLIIRYLPDK